MEVKRSSDRYVEHHGLEKPEKKCVEDRVFNLQTRTPSLLRNVARTQFKYSSLLARTHIGKYTRTYT